MHASILCYFLDDIWALPRIKYADFIQLGSPQYKSHFVQIVTFSMMRTVIFFMAKTDKTAKYVPEKFELISRKKDFFINWVKRFHVFPYYCQSIQMVHREVNKLFKDLNKNIIRTVWKEWKAKNLSVDIINKLNFPPRSARSISAYPSSSAEPASAFGQSDLYLACYNTKLRYWRETKIL